MATPIQSELKARHFALFRIRGMLANLAEIKKDCALSDLEVEYVDFLQETIGELIERWGTKEWNHLEPEGDMR